MKVLFLDMDGVLNCSDSDIDKGVVWGIDPILVARFNRLCSNVEGLTVVLSSSWKYAVRYGHIDINKLLEEKGYNGPKIVELTPNIDEVLLTRGMEIESWLKDNDVDKFVILDDDNGCEGMDHLLSHAVETSFDGGGLTESHVEQAILLLN